MLINDMFAQYIMDALKVAERVEREAAENEMEMALACIEFGDNREANSCKDAADYHLANATYYLDALEHVMDAYTDALDERINTFEELLDGVPEEDLKAVVDLDF